MINITILHPFTPEAVGLREKDIFTIHSQPHLRALQMFSKKRNFECSIDYFTTKLRKYHINFRDITYNFYPVNYKWNGDHKKWKKQSSRSCLRSFKKNTPEVTIINMSGHSSPFPMNCLKL